MPKLIDLHMHSTFSDGQFSPDELVNLAKKNKVITISITDHDDIQSVNFIKKHKKCEINFINGVELSSITKINGRNQWLHILGYGYDNTNDNLISVLNEKRKLRYDVNKKYLIDLKNELSFINDNIFDKIVCNKI